MQTEFSTGQPPVCPITGQTALEERLNYAVHGLGAVLFTVGAIALVVLAGMYGSPWHIVSVSVFGFSLALLYWTSTLYHAMRDLRWKQALNQVDHVAIFLLIAGTYTPFTLVTLRGGWGWSVFGVVWGFSALGIVLRLVLKRQHEALAAGLYIALGWVMMVAIVPLAQALPTGGVVWLLLGGVAYSAGALFYMWDRRVRYFHTVFHVFVLVGSVCHFWTVYRYVL